MSSEPILKLIEIDQELLNRRDVAAIVAFSVEAEEDPEQVRMFQGSIGFHFPNHGERGLELWDDPGVKAWGREVYAHVPHLLYYMDPEPGVGAMALAMSSLAEPERMDLLRGLGSRLVATACFARSVADPWEPIVGCLVEPLQPDLKASLQNTVAATLALTPEI